MEAAVAEIQLTKGYVAIVDDDDYQLLAARKWQAVIDTTIYAASQVYTPGQKRAVLLMHRVLLCARPGQMVDHIDGNGLNNRRANLRWATQQQNAFNRQSSLGASRYKGVSIDRQHRAWRATITVNGHKLHLGRFADQEAAAEAYNVAAAQHYGEFARLNVLAAAERGDAEGGA